MSLFQQSVLQKYLSTQDAVRMADAYASFSSYFLHPQIQENIRNSKEEQFQEGFLRELFVKILGYTINPESNFNLTTELKNVKDAKKTDGAILKDGSALAVIELKGTDTKDLEKVNDQAFNYKNNQPDCIYVITSNFEKLRFYIHNAVEHEEFNLFALTKERFALLWLFLQKDNLLGGIPAKVKEESLLAEEKITKALYADYKAFKQALWEDMVQRNPLQDQLVLYKKSQKLLDRFLFILFAEDKGLLPPNSISEIVHHWRKLRELDEYRPMYSIFLKYFGYMDVGRKQTGKPEIHAYNGGLFAADDILDTLEITDELLEKHCLNLSRYNYESEVDTNILGHIFEHSLNDIENVRAQLEGTELDKSKTKRKKDGVFYTPKYITKYIVDNTVGKLCAEKKAELGIDETEFAKNRKGRKTETLKKLDGQLKQYRQWLLQLTICDPACGSGAFLNQALEFLMAQHRYTDELETQLLGYSFEFPGVEAHILEHNIFGVDINEESVEIARLSLWLRTAKKGRKLTTLSSNLKCGNSLIDDPAVAGPLAFNWHKEFPQVFAKGGFDVVIGNPPYVGEKGNANVFEDLKKIPKWKDYYRRRSNLYYFFIKHGLSLLVEGGMQSLIIPREFISADWANKVRRDILEKSKISSILDFNDCKVFSDAGTSSLILTHINSSTLGKQNYKFDLIPIRENNLAKLDFLVSTDVQQINIEDLDYSGEKPWSFYQLTITLSEKIIRMGELFEVSQGIVTGSDKVGNKHVVGNLATESQLGRGIFILKEGVDIKHELDGVLLKINDKWVKIESSDLSYIKQYIKTEGLQKWYVSSSGLFLIYVGGNELSGKIKEYLLQFAPILINRSTTVPENQIILLEDFENFTDEEIKANYSSAGAVQKIMRRKNWWLPLYERIDIPFESHKIIVNTKNMDMFTYSDGDHYSSGGGAGGQNFIYLNLKHTYIKTLKENSSLKDFTKYVNALLNSRLIQKYILNGQYNQLSTAKIQDLAIVKISFDSQEDIFLYNKILECSQRLIETTPLAINLQNEFLQLLFSSFNIEIVSDRLQNWSRLDFKGFLVELTKAKVLLSLPQQAEWMAYFNEQKTKANALQAEINRIDKEIDQMVYQLYGLTEEEIKIVEGGT